MRRPPLTPQQAIMAAIRQGYGSQASILQEAEWILALDPLCACTGAELRCAWTWLRERGCIAYRGRAWHPTPACAEVC